MLILLNIFFNSFLLHSSYITILMTTNPLSLLLIKQTNNDKLILSRNVASPPKFVKTLVRGHSAIFIIFHYSFNLARFHVTSPLTFFSLWRLALSPLLTEMALDNKNRLQSFLFTLDVHSSCR